MPIYQYTAVNDAGAKHHGELHADSLDNLNKVLNSTGLWLLKFTIHDGTATPPKIKFKRRDLVDLFASFSAMLKAGIPLLESIQVIIEGTKNESLKYTLTHISLDIESGVPLSKAMAKHPKVFTKQVINIVNAGKHSGQLPDSFHELSKYYSWLNDLMSDIKQASTYPLIILIVVCIFIMVLFTFVIPQFTEILTNLNVKLPFITQLVLDISVFTIQYWWLLISLPIVLSLSIKSLHKHSTQFSHAWDNFKLSIPIFGEINRMIALSQFTHHFSIMFRSGIQILDCLKYAHALMDNAKLAHIIQETEKNVQEGGDMSASLEKHQLFPPMLLQMIKVGEATGNLDEAMHQISTYYDNEIPKKIKQTFTILEPVIMLSLIGIVGTVAIAIFLPMVSMLGAIK